MVVRARYGEPSALLQEEQRDCSHAQDAAAGSSQPARADPRQPPHQPPGMPVSLCTLLVHTAPAITRTEVCHCSCRDGFLVQR